MELLLILIFGGLAVASWFRPGVSLGAVICVYGIKQLAMSQSAWLAVNHQLVYLSAGLLCVVALISQYITFRAWGWIWRREQIQIICLYTLAYLSILWTVSPEFTLLRLSHFLPHVLLATVVAPLTILRMNDASDALLTTTLLGATVLAAIAFLGEFDGRTLEMEVGDDEVSRAANALSLSRFCGYVAIGCYFLKPVKLRWLILICKLFVYCTSAYILFQTQTRGQAIAIVVSIAFVEILKSRSRSNALLFVTLISLLIATFVVIFDLDSNLTFEGRWSSDKVNDGIAVRISMIGDLLESYLRTQSSWLLGFGSSASLSDKLLGIYCHNIPVEILCELGIVGLTLYLTTLVSFGIKLFSSLNIDVSGNNVSPSFSFFACLSIFGTLMTLKEGAFLGSQEVFMSICIFCFLSFQQTHPNTNRCNVR